MRPLYRESSLALQHSTLWAHAPTVSKPVVSTNELATTEPARATTLSVWFHFYRTTVSKYRSTFATSTTELLRRSCSRTVDPLEIVGRSSSNAVSPCRSPSWWGLPVSLTYLPSPCRHLSVGPSRRPRIERTQILVILCVQGYQGVSIIWLDTSVVVGDYHGLFVGHCCVSWCSM